MYKMKIQVKVAIVGGGIVGCSVLYHLARLGCSDALLLEKHQLTDGSTWHAAGNVTFFGHYPSITQLYVNSLKTYQEAEQESGLHIGFHQSGSLRFATNEKELATYRQLQPLYDRLGIEYHVVGPNEIEKLHPLLDTTGLLGAAYTPQDGHLDPSGATHAMAKAAKSSGASIKTSCEVEHLAQQSDGKWQLFTSDCTIIADHVVIATSFWARDLLQTLGLQIPVFAVEHHDFLTEPVDAIRELSVELPAIRDPSIPANIRQEGNGLLCGIYESKPKLWATDGIPADFGRDLLPNDTERLDPHVLKTIERIPAYASVGIKKTINGPICYTPDGCPLLGPLSEYPGLWLATGFSIGIGTGGGSGHFLSHWIVDGAPPFEVPAVHPDRFPKQLDKRSAISSIIETYALGYTMPD